MLTLRNETIGLGLGLDIVEDTVAEVLYDVRQVSSEQLLQLLENDRDKVVSVEYTKARSFSMDPEQPLSKGRFIVRLYPSL